MRVRITEDFTGFPDGTDASKTDYRAGQMLDLDDDFAGLIVGKGHAEEHDAPPAGRPTERKTNADR